MTRIKLLNIVGARPQIIKASAISRAITNHFFDKIVEILVHTGQHYDTAMSDVFFDELEIHPPDYNLGVGSAGHGKQTSLMITGIEEIILKESPDCVVLYGDTNSSLAGAIAASKLHCPVVHIEAGLRSFNKIMPEEINRIMCDHVSTLLFAPTNTAFKNLIHERFRPENSPPYTINNPKIYFTGDIMYDNSMFYASLAEKKKSYFLNQLSLERNNFVLTTIHRDINTDNHERLNVIIRTLMELAELRQMKFVMPFHPRTIVILKTKLEKLYTKLLSSELIKIITPASFLEMIMLEKKLQACYYRFWGSSKGITFFQKALLGASKGN